jgi:hypothetical protein
MNRTPYRTVSYVKNHNIYVQVSAGPYSADDDRIWFVRPLPTGHDMEDNVDKIFYVLEKGDAGYSDAIQIIDYVDDDYVTQKIEEGAIHHSQGWMDQQITVTEEELSKDPVKAAGTFDYTIGYQDRKELGPHMAYRFPTSEAYADGVADAEGEEELEDFDE